MKLEASWWSKFKWLIGVYRDLKKNSSPMSVLGGRFVFWSLASLPTTGVLIHFAIPEKFFVNGLDIAVNDASYVAYVLCVLTWFFGLCLIIYDIRSTTSSARKVARVLITGLPGTSRDFPVGVLSKAEQKLAREPIELGIEESPVFDHHLQVERYNAEQCVELFKRFVLHNDCNKLYIGGLSRIPFLVAYGAFLRNVSSKIVYFDKFHRDGQWCLLDDEDCNLGLKDYDLMTTPNDFGDIGIALGFSTIIDKKQLPAQLQEHTTLLSPTLGEGRNIVKNLGNLERLSNEIKGIIDKLSTPEAKRVHLFLSIQSSLAIELGRCFQEGTHKNWVIHNFDAQAGEYNWAIELSRAGINEYLFQEK
jgi:hypothetical protein